MVIGKKNMIFVLILIILFPRFGSGQGFNVGERTLLLTDSARNRMVKTELWYPTNDSDSAGK